MKPHRALTAAVLLLALCGTLVSLGAIVSAGDAYGPSPYVEDYNNGAWLNEGTVDATAVINECIATAGRARFRWPGTFLISTGSILTISDDCSLEGLGRGATTLRLADNATGTCVVMGSSAGNCALRSLTVDAFDDSSTTGIRPASGADNILVEDVEVTDFATGLSNNGANDHVTIRICEFGSNTVTGGAILQTGTACVSWKILDSEFASNAFDISTQTTPSGWLISGNTFTGSGVALTVNSLAASEIVGNTFNQTTSINFSSVGARNVIGANHYVLDEVVPSDVTNLQQLLHGKYYGTASPSSGTWLTGDRVANSTPGTAGTTAVEWVCSTGGTSGTWQALYRGLATATASETYDPASMNDNTGTSKSDFSVTGAALGNRVAVAAPYEIPAGVMVTASVVSSNTVRVSLWNHSGGVVDLASGNWTLEVTQ
jgi:hypothetical protein